MEKKKMNDLSSWHSTLQSKLRSLGVKLFVVCGLALVMLIPALLVGGLIEERTGREAQVVNEISAHVGGQQTFLGPTLAVPYRIPAQPGKDYEGRGTYLVFPTQASAVLKTATEERRRSLFKVPVFQVDATFQGEFDLTGVPGALPPGAQLDWSHAEILVGVTDARGALADGTVSADGKTFTLAPAEAAQNITFDAGPGTQLRLTLFGSRLEDIAKPNAHFAVTSNLRVSGAQRIAVLAYGKTTHLTAQGAWRSPGFDGGFLPVTRTLSPNGFTAEWSVPFIARGVRAEGEIGTITGLGATALGVSFIEVADPYQSVNRALKYVPLFLGWVFISYFIFEVTTGKRVHLAQYVLIGIAQVIFYLLLLSLAERIGFDFGFLLASVATVMLLALNAAWIFASRVQGIRAFVTFGCLYGLIYLLLRLEDNALLVGAIASFLAVGAVMYFTRGIDWYGSLPPARRTAMPPITQGIAP
jgi:inner membrane protein